MINVTVSASSVKLMTFYDKLLMKQQTIKPFIYRTISQY
ncbi:hypothetical protein C942_03923 [Photobacterium marinum]|uniref:Uncharacterized protein n=1 Tax=Photobacterium marinum TaxID=1056511 RepID=L8J398_9GAMM|nr:hypothetical protein C942_03923 [Photobacterium marinum]